MKVIFDNLQIDNFIHPLDKESLIKPEQWEIIDEVSDLALDLSKQVVLGRYVEILRHTNPRIFAILDDVCRILNFNGEIRLFVVHDYSVSFMQLGDEIGYILMNDLVLNEASDDMLYFLLGNSIGMFKGGHVRLATINSVITNLPQLLPLELLLKSKQRLADLSSDRAGLLACQNYAAAIRCILWDIGFSPNMTKEMSDNQIINIGENYNKEISYLRQGVLNEGFTVWKQMKTSVSPAHIRLNELCNWYHSEYSTFIQKHSGI